MKESIFDGHFGLERETLRVDKDGRLSQTPHPFEDDHLSRDFCESQLEIVTPVCGSIAEMMTSLAGLDQRAREVLDERGETLWLYSNPPHIDSEAEILIARYEGELSAKHEYRVGLARRYGKRMMLYSGIHFNFSFSEALLHELYERESPQESFDDFKNAAYFRLHKQVSRHSWLLVLLTAASPLYDRSFDGDHQSGTVFSGYSSMRNSKRGYWNQFIPQLDYTDLPHYVQSVKAYIDKGVLFSAGELYLPVRLKPRGENSLDALLENGVDHIELRMFDLNPLEPLGAAERDLEFAHLLLVYLLFQGDFEFTHELQAQAIADHRSAARFELDEIMIGEDTAAVAANKVFSQMEEFFAQHSEALEVIEYERSKLQNERLCRSIINENVVRSDRYV